MKIFQAAKIWIDYHVTNSKNSYYEYWLDDQNAAGLATYYENEWILNIADLVVTDQNISNDGVKLLKLRFYPVVTTLYEQASE